MNRKNILWVDDDIDRFALMADRDELESRGCKIIMAPRSEDLLKVLREQILQIDCIIIDISMPIGELDMEEAKYGMRTGFALIKKIRESDSIYKDTPIIVYTVIGDDDVRQYCKDNDILYLNKSSVSSEGFADFVMKQLNDHPHYAEKNLEEA